MRKRWGLGRTEPRSKSAKGIIQWASVVEEVLDLLRIGQCSIVAHSAGAPYALSFANKLPARIRGDICLLAPWVGGSENSKVNLLLATKILIGIKVAISGSSTFPMAY
jgi:pimeloyl-ACP methyl ester carboxylesterase